ncbi:hypothetical protein CC77DRAFT_1023007 [Alternaria alternata]|uniref:MMU163 domain containing protein n=1 Tax=Alternaria alternata TaxID=5599 RepID=A0A177DCE9_ALTAL|nr:hypothetical protein CC77DRAFT_1023007 [Alternaria alternata]XP_051593565.1 uncharacterized protein J4E82_000059 [Alternaria postmessia]KAH6846605.1 hypothetical protein B0T12DRAFT_397449 [Alternaria alternata]KAI5380862.1 hypothetical protein J4E82_000059 [Alternaria postmessia]OAG17483.1 hypothetical protein CC77DRAFT_1023007 [Alternaria alternata]OWY51142.1 uba ts-n-like protein [Alternaria alternata]
MTSGLMRRFSTSARTQLLTCPARSLTVPRLLGLKQYKRNITAVGAKQASVSRHWFTSSSPCKHPEPDERGKERLNERNLKLGNTIRVLHDRLPTLLISPLPQDILSPHISLHLFPSTHPHLPTVSGRFAYAAALWTAPVAWGQVPVLGNVKLEILSERMVKNGASSASNVRNEKLIVRWQTCKSEKKDNGQVSDVVEKITSIVAGSKRPHQEFTGLFKFEFDEEGRILNHIIEHTEEGQHWDRTAKVISVTDWLLGRAWGRREEVSPSLAFARCWREKNSRGRGERR